MYLFIVSQPSEPENAGFVPTNVEMKMEDGKWSLFIDDDKGNRLPADKYFQGVKYLLERNRKVRRLNLQAFQMTGLEKFRIEAYKCDRRISTLNKQIEAHKNLYYIYTEGYSLN